MSIREIWRKLNYLAAPTPDVIAKAQMEGTYRAFLAAAPDAIVVVTPGGKVVLANLLAEKQFGYRHDELTGQNVKNIIPEGFAERLLVHGRRSAGNTLPLQAGIETELTGRRKDRSEFPIDIILNSLEGGEEVLVTATIRDVTPRKDAERHLAEIEGSHRLVEDALRESEENYRMLLDGVQDHAIFMIDLEGRIVSWNAGAERIKGYRDDEIIGQNFSKFFPAEDIARGKPAEILRMAAANGRHQEQGMRVRKDGSLFLANVTFTALRNSAGSLRGFSEFSHDLSGSKAAKYRLLLEAAPDAMVVVDQDGKVVLVNLQAEKQFGYRRDELLRKAVTHIIPEGFAERLLADGLRSAEDALAQQIGTGIELRGRRKDGSEFPIEIMLSPLESAEGLQVTVAIRDISARKAAEETLRRSEEQFKLLVQIVADYVIYMVDLEGRVTSWNAGAQKIKGYLPEEIIGEHFERFFTEKDREHGVPQAALDAAARHGRSAKEGWRVHKDGTRFWASLVVHPIRAATGEFIGFAIVTRNATDEREAQVALGRAREALFQSQKMEAIGRLAAGVAHDFNNILQGIVGGLELVLDEVADATPAQKFTEVAINAAMRGSSLTHGLLSYARKQMLRPQAIALAPFLADVEKLLARTLGPRISIRINADRTASVLADSGQLQTALLNLAINASHAMPMGGVLTMEAREEEANQHWVALCVMDTGTGMDETTLAQAVEPFFTTKGLNGTGLGLSMVQGFVEQSGGRFLISSALGQGTTVELRLPSTAPGNIRERNLLAGDHPDVLLGGSLGKSGFDVLQPNSGDEGPEPAGRRRTFCTP